jgi:hypothetical protein
MREAGDVGPVAFDEHGRDGVTLVDVFVALVKDAERGAQLAAGSCSRDPVSDPSTIAWSTWARFVPPTAIYAAHRPKSSHGRTDRSRHKRHAAVRRERQLLDT